MQLILCAAPAYLEELGAPADLNALALHRCSAFRNPTNGKVLPWYVRVGDAVLNHEVVPAFCTNVGEIEVEMVLAGRVIGSLTSVQAAPHIRAGRLVPLLVEHVPDHLAFFVYYGSRSAQPARVKAFLDLAVKRLLGNPAYELSMKELTTAESKGRKAYRRR